MAITVVGELGLDLRGPEANNMFLKPIFFDESVPDLFEVMPQVLYEQKIAYASTMKDIIQRAVSCGMQPKGDFDIYERTMTVDPVGAYVEMCYDELLNTVYQQLLKQGTDISDLSGTLVESIARQRFQEGIRKDLEKLAFYGNKAYTANPDEIVNINQTDGMWVYLFGLVAKDVIPYINTGSGAALNAGDGIEIMQEVWQNQANVLKAVPNSNKVFLVTTDLYYQYKEDLQFGTASSSAFIPTLEQGVGGDLYQGIEVRPMWDWQGYANRFQGIDQAHQVILTTKDNMVMGTNVANPRSEFRSWYDIDSELYKMRSKFVAGFNYKYEEFFVVGY